MNRFIGPFSFACLLRETGGRKEEAGRTVCGGCISSALADAGKGSGGRGEGGSGDGEVKKLMSVRTHEELAD